MITPKHGLTCLCLLAAVIGASERTQDPSSRPDPTSERGGGGTPARRAPPGPFESAKWIVTLTPDKEAEKAGEKSIEDAVSFDGAKFSSHVGKEHGFPAARFERGPGWARVESVAADGHSKCQWRFES